MRDLNQREKILLQLLIVFVLVLIIYFLIASPIIEFMNNTDDELKKNIENLNRIDRIYKDYRKITEKKDKYLTLLNKKNENITSMVEQYANSNNIARNIAYTRRSQSTIQNKYIRITTNVKFEGVLIQPLMKFIYEIENANTLLRIGYLRIYQGLKGSDTYDAVLKIDSFTIK
ncbi:MAG: type II secretion system protein GspM [Spirochaetota bacterium]|nr:type II secretion system protein GspM [Spirochaetota bacterium]